MVALTNFSPGSIIWINLMDKDDGERSKIVENFYNGINWLRLQKAKVKLCTYFAHLRHHQANRDFYAYALIV